MPSWVRQQLEDTVELLGDQSERTRAVFKQMDVRFTLRPVGTVGERPYFRAEGETDVANLIAGHFSVSAVGFSGEGSAGRRNRFEVVLPANLARPWKVGRR
jgi:hypothetical protein